MRLQILEDSRGDEADIIIKARYSCGLDLTCSCLTALSDVEDLNKI